MKTPREILLEKHGQAMPQLDAIRCEVVQQVNRRGAEAQRDSIGLVPWCLGGLSTVWAELFAPLRYVWGGLTAVWGFLILFNLHLAGSHAEIPMAAKKPDTTAKVAFASTGGMTLREKQRVLAELTGPVGQPLAEPPRRPEHRPQSNRHYRFLVG